MKKNKNILKFIFITLLSSLALITLSTVTLDYFTSYIVKEIGTSTNNNLKNDFKNYVNENKLVTFKCKEEIGYINEKDYFLKFKKEVGEFNYWIYDNFLIRTKKTLNNLIKDSIELTNIVNQCIIKDSKEIRVVSLINPNEDFLENFNNQLKDLTIKKEHK